MTKYWVNEFTLISIANAIRNKTGGSSALVFPNGFISGINELYKISDSTVTTGTLADGVIAYNSSGQRLVGNLDNTVNVTNFKGTVSKITSTLDDYLLTITS